MRKTKFHLFFCLFLTVFSSTYLQAQTIENSINLYGASYPQEKIHIHFDKESYLPGETIWFKAYVFEENLPSERSTNFYAALYDEKGKLVQQQMSPVFSGSSDGHFTIPDSLGSAGLICRAYTNWMLNFDTAMLFTRAIKIISNKTEPETSKKTVSLQFFPEGGQIIGGIVNTIAFKASYNNGIPYFVNGVIKDQETGEVIMPLAVLHDGMGKFDLDFQPGHKYYAEWVDNNGAKQQTWLPDTKPNGVSLKLSVQKDKLFYNLVNRTGNDSLHVLMYMYQKIFYKSNLAVTASVPHTGLIPTNELPSGTMQVTVFDANWQPVAERVAFLNNNNYGINAAVFTKEVSTKKRGKNTLEIFVADTIPANMSLSISDADMNFETTAHSIVSDFLLKGDVKGYIHNPAFYFTNNVDADVRNKLDLVMLTHGWRRYNWADMMVQKTPAVKFQPDDFLGVYGQIGEEAMRKMEEDEKVTLIVKTVDSTNNFYTLIPEKNGFIRQKGLVFYDSASVYFTFNKNKLLNRQMAFSNSNFTLQQPAAINNYKNYLVFDTAGIVYNPATSLFKYYSENGGIRSFNNEKTMEALVIKSGGWRNWKNDPVIKMNDRYTSGMFSGGVGGYAIDVLHDEKSWTKLDIYTYIRNTIPALVIGNVNVLDGRKLYYSQRLVTVYIDERPVENSELEIMSLSQVAFLKFIPMFSGISADAGGSVIGPILAVYTKKGNDLIDRSPTEKDLGMVKVAGYSALKEFYSPNYAEGNVTTGTDARTTLLWMPYVLTDKNNRKIPVTFYNNDFTKKIRLVLEGINDEGKMIRIEKIIE